MKNFNLKYSQTNQNKVDVTKNNNPNQVNVVDSSNPNQKSEEDKQKLGEAYESSKLVKKMIELYNNLEAAKNQYEQMDSQFQKIVQQSPFFKSVPTSFTACEIVGKMAETETTFDDIQVIIGDYNKYYFNYMNAFNLYDAKFKEQYNKYRGRKEENTSQFAANMKNYNSELAKISTLERNVELLQRKTQQFQLLAPDLQKFFSVCSLICATKKRYDRFMEMYKIPDLRDWKALIQYYTYALALIKVMEPKAYQVFPKNVQYIKPYYKGLYFSFEKELREIQIAPAKRYFGTPGK